jgi:hypothetical protein
MIEIDMVVPGNHEAACQLLLGYPSYFYFTTYFCFLCVFYPSLYVGFLLSLLLNSFLKEKWYIPQHNKIFSHLNRFRMPSVGSGIKDVHGMCSSFDYDLVQVLINTAQSTFISSFHLTLLITSFEFKIEEQYVPQHSKIFSLTETASECQAWSQGPEMCRACGAVSTTDWSTLF